MPSSIARHAISLLSAATLLLQSVATPAGARTMTREEYEACQTRDDASFKRVIETLTQSALQTGVARLDYKKLVADEWRRGGLDDVIDRQVDTTVADIIKETSWSEQLQTWWYKDKATAIAETIARRVYESAAIKTGLEGLIGGVAREVGRTLELSTADAAEPALECLKTFLGPRFGTTVAGVVSSDASREFVLDPSRATAQIGTGSVLAENSSAVTGAVILIVRRQLANIATRVSQRLVGSLLGRLVSVVAGGIGAVLIAKDLWDARNGVLPIIASEMKAKATKTLVHDELAKALSEQIGEHTREIATATADSVLDIWREFKRGHAKVVDLAERNPAFRQFLDTLRPQDLARLDEVVTIVLAVESEDGVLQRLRDGTLAEAVTRMPVAAMEIARDTRSLAQAMAWAALAGPQLQKVIDLGLHKRSSARDFAAPQLKRLLALDDTVAITRLAGVGGTVRDALFELPDASLKSLARALTEADLDSLSRYLGGLAKPARERVVQTLSANPGQLQQLLAPRVRDAVLASRDQLAAVAMLLRADTGFDSARIKDDVMLAYEGRIQPLLLWDKHPLAIGAAAALALIVLLMLRRVIGRGRRVRGGGAAA